MAALIKAGADLNVKTAKGTSSLHAAVQSELDASVQIITLLIEAGADTSIKNNNGRTPLESAKLLGIDKLVELLK